MENCSFQGQLLSVMEVLARAAAAEIDRRVGESCEVLRVEVSQSRRDIELLKRQCEAMEAELRRTRMRARRKVFYPPAADRFTPSVRVVLSEETQSSQWDRQTEPEAQHQPQQCADEAEQVLIKEECAEEDMWKNDSEDKQITEAELPPCFDASHPSQTDSFAERPHNTVYGPHSAESPTDPGSAVTHTEVYNNTFTEQQLNTHQPQEELVVKLERLESPNENTAPLDSACSSFVTEDTHAQLWPSNQCGETVNSNFLYPGQQFEAAPSSSVFPSQIELHVEGAVPRINSVGKSHSLLNAARVKRRARTFGFRRQQHQQVDEGQNAISNINTMDQCSGPQQPQHQYRDTTNLNDDLTMQSPLGSTFCGQGRTSGSGSGWPHPARRIIRTPWRCGIGEKRFSCTYCAKSFMRFSLLKEHLRSHTGEKPFSCAQCGRSFTKQCNLQRHAVVHSGEKPYGCSLCGKAFTQRSSLKSHQKTAH